MAGDLPVKVIQTKRSPPIWSVKIGARYDRSFLGDDAKERAMTYAKGLGRPFEIVEKPPLSRKQGRPKAAK